MSTPAPRKRFSGELWLRLSASLQYHEDGTVSVDDLLWEDIERQARTDGRRLRRRVQIFPDGVEVDGVPLPLTGNGFHIMQCFRNADRVTEEAIAEAVWGDKTKKSRTVCRAFDRLKAITRLAPFHIDFSCSMGIWEMLY